MGIYAYLLEEGIEQAWAGETPIPIGRASFAYKASWNANRDNREQAKRLEKARAAWRGRQTPVLVAVGDTPLANLESSDEVIVLRWRPGKVRLHDTGYDGLKPVGYIALAGGRPSLFDLKKFQAYRVFSKESFDLLSQGLVEYVDLSGKGRLGGVMRVLDCPQSWPSRPGLVFHHPDGSDSLTRGPVSHFERLGFVPGPDGRVAPGSVRSVELHSMGLRDLAVMGIDLRPAPVADAVPHEEPPSPAPFAGLA
jgi:hypothetical protein